MSSPSSTANLKLEKCWCGVSFTKRISWTKENPGSQFKTCVFMILIPIGGDAKSLNGLMNLKWLIGKEK